MEKATSEGLYAIMILTERDFLVDVLSCSGDWGHGLLTSLVSHQSSQK